MRPRKPSTHAEGDHNHVEVLKDVYKVLRGNVSYGRKGWKPGDPNNTATGLVTDNIDGAWASVNLTLAADTQFTVTHNLLRVPIGFHVVRQGSAGTFYDSGATWTTTQIFLKFNAINPKATFFIF